MFTSILDLFPLLCLLLSARATAENSPPYVPTDTISLNCGESPNTAHKIDGKNWDGDEHSKFYPSNSGTNSFVSRALYQDQSVPAVPYMTARIIRSNFSYTLPVSAGPKFLRLYFYPVPYSGLDITTSFFSVSANNYTLLNNFSAYLTVSAMDPPVAAMIKEFVITISEEQILYLNFNPSPSSLAFINGIEVVSMPENLYVKQNDIPITFVNNRGTFFYFDQPVALETAYRLNVGGLHVSSAQDTGMFREWNSDLDYIDPQVRGTTPFLSNATIKYTSDTPAYVAPTIVYTTSRTMYPDSNVSKNYNLTWIFSVDPGFNYLVRLHFCETMKEITRENQRVFSIFINNQTANDDADIINWAGGSGIPVYKDFVVLVPAQNTGKQDFWLALHPMLDLDPLPKYANAILNGLEIFKLNNSNGNLAGPNPDWKPKPNPQQPQPRSPERPKNIRRLLIVIIIAAVLIVAFSFSLLCFIVLRRKRKGSKESASGTTKQTKSSWGPISYTKTSVNTNASSLPSDICRRFSIVEIKEATSDFDDQYIIGSGGFGQVYKGYIDDGSTTVAIKRLNSSSNQGIHEFHTEIEMISKVRHLHIVSLIGYCVDFGEMILVYDFGYLDPEYFRRQHLTEKSDVYSFGVVLLEVLCARPAVMKGVSKEEVSLVSWAKLWQARGDLEQIVDPNLRGEIAAECLKKFVEIAETCVRDEGFQRPMMGDVVWGLEFALQLQEASEKNIDNGNVKRPIEMNDGSPLSTRGEVNATDDDDDDDDMFSGSWSIRQVSGSRSTISSGGKSMTLHDDSVFSEIMNPKGRSFSYILLLPRVKKKMSSNRRGPPKHQNQYAWKPNAGVKINEKEVGGKLRPYSEITGVCQRCKEQIDWKRRYGKYKPLTEPAKCQSCSKRAVRQAYHSLCTGCAKEQNVCAKCRCRVKCVVGRDLAEVEAEQKMLEEAIKNARERDRRTILRAMDKCKSNDSEKTPANKNKVGELFPTASLDEYAAKSRGYKGSNDNDGDGINEINDKDDNFVDDEDEASDSDLDKEGQDNVEDGDRTCN
ncbi:hypothetical protein Pint_18978 [Pistacia integerrima]|uniref:Uncharacterized protein n=1 Tax=Pistacia integerrima TaxID=434235 RepID=A0ACC0Z212_9ROSI|nr:hypothetical protein Pint_18978 [Pistacia integerrima]